MYVANASLNNIDSSNGLERSLYWGPFQRFHLSAYALQVHPHTEWSGPIRLKMASHNSCRSLSICSESGLGGHNGARESICWLNFIDITDSSNASKVGEGSLQNLQLTWKLREIAQVKSVQKAIACRRLLTTPGTCVQLTALHGLTRLYIWFVR